MPDQELNAFVRGLRTLMDAEGWRMKTLSEAAGMGESAVRDLFRYRSAPKVTTAAALARAMGHTVDEIMAVGEGLGRSGHHKPAIAVAGRVGAGAKVDLVDAFAKGDGLYRVTVPDGLSPRGLVAVEVEGDSMAPIYQPGTVLFYSREAVGVPSEAIGRICVCEDEGGQAWVKAVRVGREEGTFSLISLNPEAENMHGVRLTWAAPVKYSLPPDFVQRLETGGEKIE